MLKMASTGRKLLLVAFFVYSTAQISSFDLFSYLVSVIEHLAEVEPGTVKCVFYGLSSQHPFDNELETVLRSPRLPFVTKYVLSGESTLDYTQLPKEPTLVLIQGSNVVPFSEAIVRTLVIFNPGTKVVVLVNTATIDYQAYLSLLGLYLKFRNAVLLDKVNMKVVKSQAVELKIGFDLIWDLKHAYVKFRYLAKLEIPKYFDKAQRLYRYRILDESLNMEVRVYKFFERYPLISTFEYALTAFIESGIWTYWNELHERKECGMIGESLETSSFLSFEDIFPAMVFIWGNFQFSNKSSHNERKQQDGVGGSALGIAANLLIIKRVMQQRSRQYLKVGRSANG
ncbi:conserved hypothetical protein [Culex quinquefasciatus]|uniref:Uncharacterized protein n=1 Tax=Culex quinquefasciatus TaxID=7176 RepID=B0W255_CULQU|nr:conserved hypothetical protein [Culex quinquefasciatus]|eukprot:XP_001842818.1 conserved hypothetical protein [Culex quinquefasciatus]